MDVFQQKEPPKSMKETLGCLVDSSISDEVKKQTVATAVLDLTEIFRQFSEGKGISLKPDESRKLSDFVSKDQNSLDFDSSLVGFKELRDFVSEFLTVVENENITTKMYLPFTGGNMRLFIDKDTSGGRHFSLSNNHVRWFAEAADVFNKAAQELPKF